jgi:serine/threonine protein kinase
VDWCLACSLPLGPVDTLHRKSCSPVSDRRTLVVVTSSPSSELYRSIRHPAKNNTGYSRAVDLWSIGCIVPMLITSDPVMPGDEMQRRDATCQSKYGTYIHELSRSEHWIRISAAAKSFIKGCLRTDEQARLTASAALQHEWFTHDDYREDFDAAYQRAVQGWRPRPRGKGEVPIEMIDTSDLPTPRGMAAPLAKRQGAHETHSQHFAWKQSPLRSVQNNAWRVHKPLPRASVEVRGAQSPSGTKTSRPTPSASKIFASSITSQSWRPR